MCLDHMWLYPSKSVLNYLMLKIYLTYQTP